MSMLTFWRADPQSRQGPRFSVLPGLTPIAWQVGLVHCTYTTIHTTTLSAIAAAIWAGMAFAIICAIEVSLPHHV